MRPLPAALLLALFALTACAATTDATTTSALNPEFRGHRFQKVLVGARYDDLAAQQDTEQRVVAELRKAGVDAAPWGDLFFPGQEHTEDQIAAKLGEQGYDAVLTFQTSKTWTQRVSVPASGTTTFYGTGGRFWGPGWGAYPGWSTTTTYGGYDLDLPRAVYEMRLVDQASRETAWFATVRGEGSSRAEWDEVRRAAIDSGIAQLLADDVLVRALPVPTGSR